MRACWEWWKPWSGSKPRCDVCSWTHRRLRAPSEHSARLSSLGAQNGRLSAQPQSAMESMTHAIMHSAQSRRRSCAPVITRGDGLHTIDENNVVALGVGFEENASGGPPGKDSTQPLPARNKSSANGQSSAWSSGEKLCILGLHTPARTHARTRARCKRGRSRVGCRADITASPRVHAVDILQGTVAVPEPSRERHDAWHMRNLQRCDSSHLIVVSVLVASDFQQRCSSSGQC